MYRLLTTITTKGGTEEVGTPIGKGGNEIAPNMSMGQTCRGLERGWSVRLTERIKRNCPKAS